MSEAVGVEHAIATGQSTIEHLDGYLEATLGDEMKARLASPTDTVRLGEMWRAFDPDGRSFVGVNTPEELEAAQRFLRVDRRAERT